MNWGTFEEDFRCVPYPTTSVTTATIDQLYISFWHIVVIPVKLISHILKENKCDVYRASAASIDPRFLRPFCCCYHIIFRRHISGPGNPIREPDGTLRCPIQLPPCSRKFWQSSTTVLSSSSRKSRKRASSSRCALSSASSPSQSPSPSCSAWLGASGVKWQRRGEGGSYS